MRLSSTVTKLWRLRENGVTTLTPDGRLSMGGPLWPCVYLAPLRSYGA